MQSNPSGLDAFEAALAQDNPALALEVLFTQALVQVKRGAGQGGLAIGTLDAAGRRLLAHVAAQTPTGNTLIGFDAPTNLYLVTELYQAGGHRVLLEQMIAARPQERHIVLFTGTLERTRAFSRERVTKLGAFAVSPDPQAGLYDKWLWLREKLAAYAARRVFLLHHPEDVIAALAAEEIAPRYGRRMYMLHHADTVGSLAADLTGISHIAIRAEQKARMLAAAPGLRVTLLQLGISPDTAAWRNSKRASTAAPSITATCGNEGKFSKTGPLAFPAVITRVLQTTGGQHLHIGPVSPGFKRAAHAALAKAGLEPDRLEFTDEVISVAKTLMEKNVGLFLSSFPVGGALSLIEAAAAGVPIALRDPGTTVAEDLRYTSGIDFRPPDALIWSDLTALEHLLTAWVPPARLISMIRTGRNWARKSHAPDRFRRRFLALIAATEGRDRRPLVDAARRLALIAPVFDADYYCQSNPDVAAAGVAPLHHYLNHGETENRRPSPLFDPAWYLNTLPKAERARAADLPFTHYLMRGEALGYAPYPLFDPALCAQSLARLDPQTAKAAGSVLQAYLHSRARIVPHTLFDPSYYVRQLPYPPEGVPLLLHFLQQDDKIWLSPHPLINAARLTAGMGQPGHNHLRALLDWLQANDSKAAALSPHVLFDPAFMLDKEEDPYSPIARNQLWGHLIEGNQRDRNPHILISLEHIEGLRPGTLTEAGSVLITLARNRLGVDTHPLISNAHIEAQAPWLADAATSPMQYYLENGAAQNIDPHPWISTQFYLYNNPDLVKAKICPLVHYLVNGQFEGRLPHAFFEGNHYYQTHLKQQGGGSPILHYARQGAGLFLSTQAQEPGLQRLTLKTACGLIEEAAETARTERPGGHALAARMLMDALHSETAMPHPTLVTETRHLLTKTPADLETVQGHAPTTVLLQRPSVVAGMHIAPAGGEYATPPAEAACFSDALLVPGNDGFGLTDTEGRAAWFDPGLAGFDPKSMALKENGSVVAVGPQAVLLRRHKPETAVPAGIFCGGTYSRNYYHFLIEVLPRVLLAADLAPKGTPILADDGMPAQHYQALRLLLPHHPVQQLARMRSYRVGRLYAATMPNIVQDAFLADKVAADAVRYHPQALRRLASLGAALAEPQGNERLLLWRESGVRRLLNANDLLSALQDRDFVAPNCAQLSFADQVRLMAQAEAIVGQSGAHLANMLFARPGTRVFPLYSNAPGTNYSIWSGIGAVLGQTVTNVVGWHIFGTAGPGRPEAHDDFTLPVQQLLPFFPQGDELTLAADLDDDDEPAEVSAKRHADNAQHLLDALHKASAEADVLTGAWSVMAGPTPAGFAEKLVALRRRLHRELEQVAAEDLPTLLRHPFLLQFSNAIRSSYPLLQDHDAAETARLQYVQAAFTRLAAPQSQHGTTGQNDFHRLLIWAMLYVPAWKLPLIHDLAALSEPALERYLAWLAAPSFLYRKGEDAAWVAAVTRLLDWTEQQLGRARQPRLQLALGRMAVALDLGQLLLVDCPLGDVVTARNRLLERIALNDGAPRATPRPLDGRAGRIRVGVLCRTFEKGPDSEAVVAFFKSFDQSRFEIYAYSVGFRDRVVSADSDFARAFDRVIDHRRLLSSDPAEIRAQLLADDLDVFLYANATTYGIRALDIALYHRIAPRQAVLNSHVPMPMGYPSFDAFLTGQSDDPASEVPQADFRETLVRLPGPVISYLTSMQPKKKPPLGRADLGLAADDVVLMNAGALSKLRHECLLTMMRAAAAVPKGVLLLAPYNPGWVARSQAFAFNHQIVETAAEAGLDLARVKVMGELSVAEAEAALQLADLYLTPFPHGGATMVHLALIYGVPPVVLRRRSTRSIDQFLVGSLGFPELLASTPDAYVALAVRLAQDPKRRAFAARIAEAAKHPVFVDSDSYSQEMERAVRRLLQP
ncbi:glycosyltransferase 61 family protein [Cypionkella sp.]|uniref:glycosyltransferase 61 family protein n=1 Tax=Cypionkella sp. TaxID=2811411 RepID=UPI00272C3F44|nr:glycosyltransferase 61 family protein [Cypionkella sp.]